MNAAGAKLHVETILGHLDAARKAVRDLDRRDGSKALGCASSRAVFAAELEKCPIHRAQRQRLLDLFERWIGEPEA